jgi:hypothetical protein
MSHLRLTFLFLFLPTVTQSQSLQTIGLPYTLNDNFGSNWDVQFDGSIGDGGNDLYDGGGRLFIDGQFQFVTNTGQASLDASRNEILFPATNFNGLNVSRRVAAMPALGAMRFVEILENSTDQPRRATVRVYFNLGGAVASATPLQRERDRDRDGGNAGPGPGARRNAHLPLGYAIQDRTNALAMIGAGAGAKVLPRFNFQHQSDNVDLFYDFDIPARQTAVIVHVQLRRALATQAAAVWQATRDKDLIRDLPKDLLKKIVNFRTGDGHVDDLEILRGEALDVVELRGGDAYRGSLVPDHWRIHTLYGPITLPSHKVVALLNVGKYRANQLLVTDEGEVIAGRLDTDTIELRLTSGQTSRIPLSQVTRLGYRRRPGDVDAGDWSFEYKPTAYLRGGQRLHVNLAKPDFALATPIGPLNLPNQLISSIVFAGGESHVPTVTLRDGTKFSALLPAPVYEATLPGICFTPGPELKVTTRIPYPTPSHPQRVRLPSAALLRFAFSPEPEVEDLAPRITLSNRDELIGSLIGVLTLHTPFDTIKIEGPQIKRLAPAAAAPQKPGAAASDVQITLWDDSTLSGRLADSHLTCQLRCGLIVKAPISLVHDYLQPLPQPSELTSQRIRVIAKDLDADDWQTRERAHSQILSVGPPAISVLQQLRPTQATEARQRIDLILQSLSLELRPRDQNPLQGAFDSDGQDAVILPQ